MALPGRREGMCLTCGRTIKDKVILEMIDGQEHIFDKQGCLAVFRKLRSVYGQAFWSIQ